MTEPHNGGEQVADPVDLSTCDREPIHVPGAIQAHGVLIALDTHDLSPVYASANCDTKLGIPAAELLGRPLRETLGANTDGAVRAIMSDYDGDGADPAPFEAAGMQWDATWYRSGGLAVVELEPPGDDDATALLRTLRGAIERLREARGPDELHEVKAREIRQLTGFDRVLVYRFHDDDHGEVIAEARPADARPYLGHHFPSGDIPSQARRLYVLNPIRGVADARAEPVPLVGLAGAPATALDMSHSPLRILSPIHREYLRNMGVTASLSVSLLRGEHLWGLMVCHHPTPRRVGARVRAACRMIVEVGTMQLMAGESAFNAARRSRLAALKRDLTAQMLDAESLAEAVVGPEPGLMRALRADGIAARLDGEIATAGATPAPAVTASLLDGLTRAPDRAPIARDDMTLTVAGDDAQLLPGMLATTLPGAGDDAVVWFRREHARRITWAGDPTEPALPDAQGTGTLHPRASFAEWIQEVRGLSEPWSEDDIESAASIGRSLADAMLTRARERLAYLGQHDALTGLANRHVFDRLLADALNRAEASGTRVAVLFADLDRFKSVNDRLGHAAGDELLRHSAERLRRAIRTSDIAARVGGDEFVVLCEDITPPQARQVVDRITATFAEPFHLDAGTVTVTASVGLQLSEPGMDARRLVGSADEAMYEAKRAGRAPAR